MIRLSNGHVFEYMAASGALAFDGKGWPWEWPLRYAGLLNPSLFTVVIKTLTLQPRRGNLRWYNPFGCIRILKEGTLNAVGLTNPGIEWWCRKIGPKVNSAKIPLVGSILSDSADELAEMAGKLNSFDLVALEINASCPNTGADFLRNIQNIVNGVKAVKKVSRFSLILKLSVIHDIGKILPGVEGIVEAISINSVPWSIVFPGRKSPLEHLGGGGVSGRIVQSYTWDFVKKLVAATKIPIIGPSVWDYKDIGKLRKLGARAISFGSVFLSYPWRPTLFVRKDRKGIREYPGPQAGAAQLAAAGKEQGMKPKIGNEAKDRIILPLDVSSVAEARSLVDLLKPHVGVFKVGLEFIYSTIADLLLRGDEEAIVLLKEVRALAKALGAEHVFWDGKLCDIPNTVKGASVAISRMGVQMFNVHASAGKKAVMAAVANKGNSLVLGVTVLTSIGKQDDGTDECVSIFGDNAGKKVVQFARMLCDVGADGIICAPAELLILSEAEISDGLLRATPNVRPEWAASKDDQDKKRQMTPGEAIKAGADYLVIGRPITKPPAEIGGPVEAAKRIADEIATALEERGGSDEPSRPA